jgi:hypothetical protein
MTQVKLRNGSEEKDALVATMQWVLKALRTENYQAFYHLVTACRARNHRVPDECTEALKLSGLVEKIVDGHAYINHAVINIVLSAVEGDDQQMEIVSPIVDE